jgi:hypothetical protein
MIGNYIGWGEDWKFNFDFVFVIRRKLYEFVSKYSRQDFLAK